MKKLLLLITALLHLFASCYHENQPQIAPPENLLSKTEMVNILTDIYVAEGALAYHRMNKELTEDMSTNYYKKVFDEHHISHRILKDNLRYYNSTPEVMEEILEDVLSNLSKLQADIMAMKDEVNDTISSVLFDTLPDNYIPSLFYQDSWSFASLIDSLLIMPIDNDSTIMKDSVYSE